ncbi:hypothetical protein AWP77_04070 [Escherichia coli]|nr:hypothetical protein AWP77_04070 [Escherichia coli]OKW62940.1 hypothetical protein AWP76_00555 [Escherichia coli]
MNNVIPLQNSPERVSLLPIAPGVDFATALSLRRMATSTGATPAYLLAPEVSALLFYMPDQRHHMLFATMWNTGIRIGEARTLTPESFDCQRHGFYVKGVTLSTQFIRQAWGTVTLF